MNTFKVSFLFILTLCLTTLNSCTNSTEEKTVDKIAGDWIIKSASREGKVIQTLEGSYLKLSPDMQLTSNLPISPSANAEYTVPYSIEEEVLKFKLGEKEYSFKMLETEGELKLSSTLSGKPFTFVFVQEEK